MTGNDLFWKYDKEFETKKHTYIYNTLIHAVAIGICEADPTSIPENLGVILSEFKKKLLNLQEFKRIKIKRYEFRNETVFFTGTISDIRSMIEKLLFDIPEFLALNERDEHDFVDLIAAIQNIICTLRDHYIIDRLYNERDGLK